MSRRNVRGWRARLAAVAIVVGHAWPAAAQAPSAAVPMAPLTVAKLLAAVDRTFPLLEQARATLDAALGRRGAFRRIDSAA